MLKYKFQPCNQLSLTDFVIFLALILCQVYFTVTINGREVHSVENTNPKTFTNVRVFAGDKFKPAADASYRNLLWENFHVNHSFDIGTKIQRNKAIGTIDSWGPFFRVSFDLIIHSFRQYEWTSLLAFRGNGATCQTDLLSGICEIFYIFAGKINFFLCIFEK